MHAGSSRATSYGKSRRLATDLDIRAIVGAVPPSYADACRHLARDPAMRALIRRHGPCGLAPAGRSPYEALTRAIAHQQLNGRAASTILGRFVALFPNGRFPAPELVLAARPDDSPRGVLTRQGPHHQGHRAPRGQGPRADAASVPAPGRRRARRATDADPRGGPMDGRNAAHLHARPARRA